jgi:hypothetical protein
LGKFLNEVGWLTGAVAVQVTKKTRTTSLVVLCTIVLLFFCIAADQLQIILKELLEAPHNPADMQIANQVGKGHPERKCGSI